ncbi:transcription initiation factor TFIID subunit [Trifolium repens]|nr:transcription initiation factor TFIID subunit [Trifolium repens]
MKGVGKDMTKYLNDFQFGVGTSGGVEAILHSANRLLSQRHEDGSLAMLAIDFSNIFNMVDMSALLHEVRVRCPSISLWVEFLYGRATRLYIGDDHIMSSTGVQQVQHMMYGFGDDPNPLPESVVLMDDIVVEYITELIHKAQDIGSQSGKLSVEDFLYLIRKDAPKLNRCTELLSMNKEIKQAQKLFELDEENLRKTFEDESADG